MKFINLRVERNKGKIRDVVLLVATPSGQGRAISLTQKQLASLAKQAVDALAALTIEEHDVFYG